MAYVSVAKTARREASEMERVFCVTAICALAAAPLAICLAFTIWGA